MASATSNTAAPFQRYAARSMIGRCAEKNPRACLRRSCTRHYNASRCGCATVPNSGIKVTAAKRAAMLNQRVVRWTPGAPLPTALCRLRHHCRSSGCRNGRRRRSSGTWLQCSMLDTYGVVARSRRGAQPITPHGPPGSRWQRLLGRVWRRWLLSSLQ